jgi:hypothetical protein
MGERNELPDGPAECLALCRQLLVSLRLRLRHLPLRRGLCLGDLRRQRLDGLDDRRTEGLHARVVRFGKGTARIGAAASKQDARLAVLAQH